MSLCDAISHFRFQFDVAKQTEIDHDKTCITINFNAVLMIDWLAIFCIFIVPFVIDQSVVLKTQVAIPIFGSISKQKQNSTSENNR